MLTVQNNCGRPAGSGSPCGFGYRSGDDCPCDRGDRPEVYEDSLRYKEDRCKDDLKILGLLLRALAQRQVHVPKRDATYEISREADRLRTDGIEECGRNREDDQDKDIINYICSYDCLAVSVWSLFINSTSMSAVMATLMGLVTILHRGKKQKFSTMTYTRHSYSQFFHRYWYC